MEITSEQRKQALATADTQTTDLYSDTELGIKLFEIAKKYHLEDQEKYHVFAVGFGDLILKLITIETLEKIFSEKFNLSLLDLAAVRSELLILLKKTNREEIVPSNPHIRTMAQDMIVNQSKDEVTYSSTQAAILNEAKPKDESADRWGSENK